MTPTTQQIADLRADIGDETETAFTDDEITRIWARVAAADNATDQHEAALALMARQLMANAAKFADYTAGDTSEKRQQIFQNLEKLYKMYKPALNAVLNTNRQVARLTIRPKPRQNRQEPGDYSDRGY